MMTTSRARGALLLGLGLVAAGRGAAQEARGVLAPTIESPQYFAVLVADAERSAQWYGRAFGLRELDRASAEDGSWEIVNLASDRLLVEIIRDDRAQPVARARGFFKVGFAVPDVDAVADAVQRETGERPRVIDLPAHGLRMVQVRDPDGNTLQLFSRPER